MRAELSRGPDPDGQLEIDTATACGPEAYPRQLLDEAAMAAIIGRHAERLQYDNEHEAELDRILEASCEFRHHVIPPPLCMCRGEAQHILRALRGELPEENG